MTDDPRRRNGEGMKNTAAFRRVVAAAGLVLTALMMVGSTIFAPEFPADRADQLAAIAEGGSLATTSAFLFVLAQLPFVAAVLGIGHLLRARSPRLSNIGTTLALVGAFGHSFYGGITMAQVAMAADEPNRAVHVAVLDQVESEPVVAFIAMGLLGTVLGILLLSLGVFRAGVGPRWVGPALWAFLIVEFAGQGLTEWASHVAVVLYVAAFVGLAVTVWRSSDRSWTVAGDDAVTAAPPREAFA